MRLYPVVLLLLIGCSTPAERAAREAAYLAELETRCAKIGFKADTEAMAQCKLSMMNSDEASVNAQAAVAAQNRRNMQEATRLRVTPPPPMRTY